MTEHPDKGDKFRSMLATRLPNAIKAIALLKNLSRKRDYDYMQPEVRSMLDALYDEVDLVADAFGVPAPVEAPVAAAAPAPSVLASEDQRVERRDRADIRWAHDMLRRGDHKDAEKLIRNVISKWIEEERQ